MWKDLFVMLPLCYFGLYIYTYAPTSAFYALFNYFVSNINFPAILVLTFVVICCYSQQEATFNAEDYYFNDNRYQRRMPRNMYESQMFQERNEYEERRDKIEKQIPKLKCETIYKPSCWFTEEDKEDLELLKMVESSYKTKLSEGAQKECTPTIDDFLMEPEHLKKINENIENITIDEECKKYSCVWNEVNRIKESRNKETPFKDINNNQIVKRY